MCHPRPVDVCLHESFLQPPCFSSVDPTWNAALGVFSLSLPPETQISWDPFLQVWQVTGKGHPLPHTMHKKLAEVLSLSIGTSVKQVAVGEMPAVRDHGLPLRSHCWRCWNSRDHGQSLGAEVTYRKKQMPLYLLPLSLR